MYFVYDYNTTIDSHEKCTYLPQTFNRNNLKLDVTFTHGGETYVQHQALVTFQQCTSEYIFEIKDYVFGYMTPDEQYCVPECTGIYAPGKEGSRICSCRSYVAPDGKTCLESCDNYDSYKLISNSNIRQCTCKNFADASGEGCKSSCGSNEEEAQILDNPSQM